MKMGINTRNSCVDNHVILNTFREYYNLAGSYSLLDLSETTMLLKIFTGPNGNKFSDFWNGLCQLFHQIIAVPGWNDSHRIVK
jgi:hypothetical protein